MGVVIKQSLWGTIITYVGVIIGYVNTLYLRPEFFSLDEIGLFTLVTANAMMLSPLCAVGMSGSYIKYFPAFKDSKKLKNQFFTLQFSAIVLSNLLILFIAYLNREWLIAKFSEGSSNYANYLAITAIIVVVNSLFDHLFAISSTVLRVIFPSFLREVFLRLGAIVLVLGYAGGFFGFDWAVKGLAINYSAVLLLLFLKLVIFDKLRFDFSLTEISPEWRKKIFQFSIYSMSLAVSFAVMNNVSYNQVTNFMGDAANGIFVTCFFIGTIVEMPRRNMARVVAPLISDSLANNKIEDTNQLYKKSSITMSVIGMLLFIGILTNLDDLFAFIPKGEDFALGYGVVLAVCGAKLLMMFSSFAGEIINYSEFYRYNLLFLALAAVTLIILNYILIPLYGLNGVAISYFATITVHSLVKFLFVKVKFGIHPFMRAHVKLLVIGGLVLLGFYLFDTQLNVVLNIIFRSVLTTIVFTFLAYRLRISSDINQLIASLLSKYLKIRIRS